MKHFFRKLLFASITLSFLILLTASFFAPSANAQLLDQGPWYFQGLGQWYTKVHDDTNQTEIFGERYTAAQVNWIINALITWIPTALFGTDSTICILQFIGDSTATSECASIFASGPVGAALTLGKSDSPPDTTLAKELFKDRPLSGITTIKNDLKKLTFTPNTYAQSAGFGYTSSLTPVQNLWVHSRDIAYSLVIFVVIITALAIMLRAKVSGNAVLSLQAALPNLVISLILITFSYAIAGLLVDFMYIAIALIAVVLGDSPIETFNYLVLGPKWLGTHWGIFGVLISFMILYPFALLLIMMSIVVKVAASATLGPAGPLVAALLTVILVFLAFLLAIILFLAFLYIAFKIIIMLFTATARLLILTIFSPFAALLGALPGTPYSFGKWISDFVQTLAVFPVLGLMIMLAHLFLDATIQGAIASIFSSISNTIPVFNIDLPGIPNTVKLGTTQQAGIAVEGWPPLLTIAGFDLNVSLIYLVVSVVILFMTPKASQTVQNLMKGQGLGWDLKGEFGHFLPTDPGGGSASGFATSARRRLNTGDWRTRKQQETDAVARGRSPTKAET